MEREPLPLRRLIDEAFGYLRRHFVQIYFPVAIPVALVSGMVPLAQGFWFKAFNPRAVRPDMFFAEIARFMAVVVLLVAVVGLAHVVFLIASMDAVSGSPVDMSRAWKRGLQPRVFGTSVLASLVAAGGTLCCLIPGIYAAVVFALVVPVMVSEGKFGTAALGRSNALTTYNPRGDLGSDPRVKVFLILLVGWLIAYVIGMLVSLPAIIVQQIAVFRSVASGTRPDPQTMMRNLMWIQVPLTMLQSLAREAVSLYVSLALALFFFDLRERREGADLEKAIDVLGGSAPTASGS